jgi:hypothetical protein
MAIKPVNFVEDKARSQLLDPRLAEDSERLATMTGFSAMMVM